MPSAVKIGPPVPEKKIFEFFFTEYGHDGHLGHVTWIINVHISSPLLNIKFGFDWSSGFRAEDL